MIGIERKNKYLLLLPYYTDIVGRGTVSGTITFVGPTLLQLETDFSKQNRKRYKKGEIFMYTDITNFRMLAQGATSAS
jgi:hypothetical protein